MTGPPEAWDAETVRRDELAGWLAGPVVSSGGVAKALVWAGSSQAGQLLIQLPVAIALAHLVAPRDFGLMAMTLVISGFLTVVVEAGLGVALVQREALEERHLSTAFWINLALGAGLMVVVAAAAPGIAALYGQPRLTLLTVVLSVDFFLGAFGIVQLALLQRQLRLRRIAGIQNAAVAVGGATAIIAAAAGAGVWSLVIDTLVATAVQSVLATVLGLRRIRGRFDRDAARDLWRLSGGQSGFQAINYWSRNADNLIIGRFVGASGLGLYDRAYQLMMLPITQVGAVVSYVLLPAMSRLQADPTRLKSGYLRSVAATSLLAFPVVAGIFAVAPDVVHTLFGAKWSGMTPVLRLLCVAALPQSVGTTTGVIYQVCGRTDWLLRWGLVTAAITVAAFAVGVAWGIEGVAAAYAIRTLGLHYFNFAIPGRLIGMRYRDVFGNVLTPLLLAVTSGVVMWVVGEVLPSGSSVGRLGVEIAAGAVVYLLGVALLRPSSYREVKGLLWRR